MVYLHGIGHFHPEKEKHMALVEQEIKEGIGILTLNNTGKQNALSEALSS